MAGGRHPKKKQSTFWAYVDQTENVECTAAKRGLDKSKYIVESLGINLKLDELQIEALAKEQNITKEDFIINILAKEIENINKRKNKKND